VTQQNCEESRMLTAAAAEL